MSIKSPFANFQYFIPLIILGGLLSLLGAGLTFPTKVQDNTVDVAMPQDSLSEPPPKMEANKLKEFESLLKTFRCITCQNQSLADSNAPVALAIKKVIYLKLSEGASEAQIKTYLAAQYGDSILYSPPLKKQTFLLWFAPGLFFILASFFCWRIFRATSA